MEVLQEDNETVGVVQGGLEEETGVVIVQKVVKDCCWKRGCVDVAEWAGVVSMAVVAHRLSQELEAFHSVYAKVQRTVP